MNIDLNAPIWAIDHLAAALGVTVDTAREHTYSSSFPAARAGFARNLWLRDEVLAWFSGLPAADRSRPARRKNPKADVTHPAIPAADPTLTASTYTPRRKKAATA
ncbi:hypothetical protein AERO_10020 [Aeromicrobium fastidiosum]|uniref:hypothetical protein n=1 Tax=Aeromicrobium fastidiosum TaxID=52699 RepID=UPI0020235A9A|nr:hypothetical protein [Aeromicrobium fastidiosum]MCL8251719.1 hypothetical protein [Aeromicrobium fastidiosum]